MRRNLLFSLLISVMSFGFPGTVLAEDTISGERKSKAFGSSSRAADPSELAELEENNLVLEFTVENSEVIDLGLLNQTILELGYSTLNTFTYQEKLSPNYSLISLSRAINSSEANSLATDLSKIGTFGLVAPNKSVSKSSELIGHRQLYTPWGLGRIDQTDGTEYVNEYDTTGAGVDIYVFDTWIDENHSEFADRVTLSYSAFLDTPTTETCPALHGTHVAGTALGSTYGVAKDANLIPVRVLDCNGVGTTARIIAGIDLIIEDRGDSRRPAVFNMSLGADYSPDLNNAVLRAHEAGIVVVVASGNGEQATPTSPYMGVDACDYSPASAPVAITVNASDVDNQSRDFDALFSNYGPCTDIYAPGVGIESARSGGGSVLLSGTSMAAPHVSGVAARILQENPSFTPTQVWNQISTKAKTVDFQPSITSDAKKLLRYEPSVRALVNTYQPFMIGSFSAGESINVVTNSNLWDSGVSFSYQWLSDNNPISGATAETFTIPSELGGTSLKVAVTGSKPGYTPIVRESEAVAIPLSTFSSTRPVPFISISSNELKPGSTVNFSVSPDVSGSSIYYQWHKYKDGLTSNISGANSNSYQIQSLDESYYLGVSVFFSKTGYEGKSHSYGIGFVNVTPVAAPVLLEPPFPAFGAPASLKTRKTLTLKLNPGGTNSLNQPVSVSTSGACKAVATTVMQTVQVPTQKKVVKKEKYQTTNAKGKTVTKTRSVVTYQTVYKKTKKKVIGGYKFTMTTKNATCQINMTVSADSPYKSSTRTYSIAVTK